jgi:hypothetical protein
MNDNNSQNARDVLKVFLESPDRSLRYLEISKECPHLHESQIRLILRRFAVDGLVDVTKVLGRPAKGDKPRSYKLKDDLENFKKIFNIYDPGIIGEFLKTNYCNKLISNYKIVETYTIIREKLGDPKHKRIASEALLSLPAVMQEYENYADSIYIYLKKCAEESVNLRDYFWFYEIGVLEDLDPVKAIPFYREQVAYKLVDLYKKIGGREVTSFSDNVVRYNELDIYLGPYLSYPIYDPIKILFSKPFDRLYEDIYIFNEGDLKLMVERIHLVYKNFAELLSLYINKFDWRYTILLEKSLREYVFLWNCASCYFNDFYFRCENVFNVGSGYYYITSNSGFIQVVDLIDNNKLISPELATQLKTDVKYPPLHTKPSGKSNYWGGLKYDPFEVLSPCKRLFDRFGFDTEVIPIERILSEMNQRLEK